MASQGLHDPNLAAHARLPLAGATYDALVVDEVQDMTPVQLALLLRLLKDPHAFLLCGDAHQVVHPNFFSWTAVRELFWGGGVREVPLSVLDSNFRNAREITRVANRVLSLKHARFGSVDRESTALVTPASAQEGQVSVLPLDAGELRTLNEAVRRNARFAVIVLRDEDKAAARAHLQTPLVFSVQEVKGLEYDGVVLYNLIGSQRRTYTDIAGDLRPDEVEDSALTYRRARDKTDKSLERAKFYVNALYVALTRAVEQVVLVEDDPAHPLLDLLGVRPGEKARVEARVSSAQEWAAEALRLQAQGKTEQAQAIVQEVLQYKPVPWAVLSAKDLSELAVAVFHEEDTNRKHLRDLFEGALWQTHMGDVQRLHSEVEYGPAKKPGQSAQARLGARQELLNRELAEHRRKNTKWVHHACDMYGPEHRNRFGATPLMLAALAGNAPLTQELLDRGADPARADDSGLTPVMHALHRAALDPAYRQTGFAEVFDLLAPLHLDVQVEGRMLRLNRGQGEYHVLLRMLSRTRSLKFAADDEPAGLTAADLTFSGLPEEAPTDLRQPHAYISGVLARGEMDSTYRPARKLWQRMAHGAYLPNPELFLRVPTPEGPVWRSLFEALNLIYADLPSEYDDQVRPLQVRELAAPRVPGTPLSRIGPEPDDDHTKMPHGLMDRYFLGGMGIWAMMLLFGQTEGLTSEAFIERWRGDQDGTTLARSLRRLRGIRLIVRDDAGGHHALLDEGEYVFVAGGLMGLSDEALQVLLAWQNWRLPEGVPDDALQELRDAGFTGVVEEALRGDPFPEYLKGKPLPFSRPIQTGPSREDIRRAVLKALQDAGTCEVGGDAIVVEFGQDSFFQFTPGDEPGWLVGEISGPETRGEGLALGDAYRQRLAASSWTPEDQREDLNHARAWDLSEVPLEDIVDETVALALDLYGYDGRGATITVVQ